MKFQFLDCTLQFGHINHLVGIDIVVIGDGPCTARKETHQHTGQFTRTKETLRNEIDKYITNDRGEGEGKTEYTFKSKLSRTRKIRPPVPLARKSRNATIVLRSVVSCC